MKLVQNVGWSSLSVSIRLVATGAVLILQARLLGPETFAQLVFANSLSALAAIIIDCGTSLRVLRTLPVSAGREWSLVVNDLRLRTTLLVGYAILAGGMTLLLSRGAVLEFTCIFTAAAANSFGDYGVSLLRGMRRYALEAKLVAFAVSLHGIIVAIGIIILPTLFGAAVSFLIARLVYLALATAAARIALPQYHEPNDHFEILPALRQALPYAQDVIISNSLSQLDMFLAGVLLRPDALALYAIANRTFLVIDQGLGALNNVFVPSMSSVQQDRKSFQSMAAALSWLTAATGCIGTLLAILVGPKIFISVLGAAYSGLSAHIPLITIALLARLSVTASAVPVVALGAQTIRVKSQLAGLAIFLCGAWPAITIAGVDGLLSIVALTYGCTAVLQFAYLERIGIPAPRLSYLAFAASTVSNLICWY